MSVELIPCEVPVIAFICPLLLLTVMVHEGSTLVRRGNQAGKWGGGQPKTNLLHSLILPKETPDLEREENIQALRTPFQKVWTHSGWHRAGSSYSLCRLSFILSPASTHWKMSWDAAALFCLEMIQKKVLQTSSKWRKELVKFLNPEWDATPRSVLHLLSRGFPSIPLLYLEPLDSGSRIRIVCFK